jgi:hypothetical protein
MSTEAGALVHLQNEPERAFLSIYGGVLVEKGVVKRLEALWWLQEGVFR